MSLPVPVSPKLVADLEELKPLTSMRTGPFGFAEKPGGIQSGGMGRPGYGGLGFWLPDFGRGVLAEVLRFRVSLDCG